MTNTEQWLAKLAHLKVDKARGDPAPHKPLLLLVVLELAEQGLLPEGTLPLSPELAFRFLPSGASLLIVVISRLMFAYHFIICRAMAFGPRWMRMANLLLTSV